ncbi:MAG: UbiA family prenyltransferase [Pyrinomonadaceae bacterium]
MLIPQLLRLVRIDTSLIGFLAIFLALYARSEDLNLSFYRALPILFICMCTFIANDLNDIENDLINHPDRPLPSNEIRPWIAATLYFLILGVGFFVTRDHIEEPVAFFYYALFLTSISYSLVADHLPVIKAPYVAAAGAAPILIGTAWYPETGLFILAASAFLITLGREICMDVQDRPGDVQSVISKLDSKLVVYVGMGLQAGGILLLIPRVSSIVELIILFVMLSILTLAVILWTRMNRRISIYLMKCIYLAGLYFLL